MSATLMDLKHDSVRPIDQQAARQLLHYEQAANDAVSQDDLNLLALCGLSLSSALSNGQVCLPLQQLNRSPLLVEARLSISQDIVARQQQLAALHTVWSSAKGEYANQPLVLDGDRLYWARYFHYERKVTQHIQKRLSQPLSADDGALTQVLHELFGTDSPIDWQKVAAAMACVQRFAVITGGPGTGKTTTVTKLLSALLSQNPTMSIALAAPTGKAAARMTESIRGAKQNNAHLLHANLIPDTSFTLHRLLGWTPKGFRYNAQHPLPFDCVVVDEASMIDLPMMAHLFDALAEHAQLILLGDRDQLASVEAGTVLADICNGDQSHGPDYAFAKRLSLLTGQELGAYAQPSCSAMQNAVASLRVSHRFHDRSGIGHLARAVNQGDVISAQHAFEQYAQDVQAHFSQDDQYWKTALWRQTVLEGYRPFMEALSAHRPVQEVFQAFDQFQVLAALRNGRFGVTFINQQIEQLLGINPSQAIWYVGRAIMITRNDYDLGLFNGDVGIALVDEQQQLKVFFPAPDGSLRAVLPSRLPAHENAYAMTVHKSQGSEFSQVCLQLPNQWQSVITRELIYTAITRAKRQFQLFSSTQCWQLGLAARVQRASGLRDALWQQPPI